MLTHFGQATKHQIISTFFDNSLATDNRINAHFLRIS